MCDYHICETAALFQGIGRKGVGTPFPPHCTHENAQQLDQVCSSWWRLQISTSPPEPVLSLFVYFITMGIAPVEGPTQVSTELTFEAFIYSKRINPLLKREVNNETSFFYITEIMLWN